MKKATAIFSVDQIKPSRFSPLGFLQVKDGYLVGSMMMIGLLLRLPSLRMGLWRDEASTYFDALPDSLGELVATVIRCELSPPGFYLMMHQWMQWFGGMPDVVLKLPALSFGLLLIAATYGLGRAVGSRATGLVAAVVTTFASSAIYYSQEARPYSLAALLCCLSVLLYCQALSSRHQMRYLVGFVLCTGLFVYTQYTGLLLVGNLLCITLYLWWRREPTVNMLLFVAFGTVFLLFAPWVPVFLIHLHTGTSGGLSHFSWWHLPNQVLANLGHTVPLVGLLRKPVSFLVLLGLGVMAGRFYSKRQARGLRSTASTPLILAGTLVLIAVVEAVVFSDFREDRYMSPFAPIAWVLYSHWTLTLWQYSNRHWKRPWDRYRIHSKLRVACCVLVGGLVLLNVSVALSKSHVAKSGIPSLVADVRRMHLQDTFYLLAPDHLGPTFGYYSAAMQMPVPFYGFPRWEHPELYSEKDYARMWQTPAAVPDAEQRIREQAQRGDRRLAFIQQPGMKDFGVTVESRTEELLTRLRQTYPLLLKTDYPAASESVTLYLFNLTPN